MPADTMQHVAVVTIIGVYVASVIGIVVVCFLGWFDNIPSTSAQEYYGQEDLEDYDEEVLDASAIHEQEGCCGCACPGGSCDQ